MMPVWKTELNGLMIAVRVISLGKVDLLISRALGNSMDGEVRVFPDLSQLSHPCIGDHRAPVFDLESRFVAA
jgi:hypothetical protein